MIVLKFGGTSVADAERILGVAAIVKARKDLRPVVVVSALAGVTDLLVRAVRAPARGIARGSSRCFGPRAAASLGDLRGGREPGARHDLTLLGRRDARGPSPAPPFGRLLGEGTPRASDTLLAFGELMSSRIVAAAFELAGLLHAGSTLASSS